MELNREQIIKALECCTYSGDVTKSQVEVCLPCPYFNEGNCTDILKENALSLIKELTEENERLSGAVKQYEEERKYHFEMSRTRIAEAQADTVRKMQEKLKQYENMHVASPCNFCKYSLRGNRNQRCDEDLQCFGFNKCESVIDQIANEMLEDTNES